jgi:hypothetical protein
VSALLQPILAADAHVYRLIRYTRYGSVVTAFGASFNHIDTPWPAWLAGA